MNSNKPRVPTWIKNLQENSWELELLISGGAIFSLFQLEDHYKDWFFWVDSFIHFEFQQEVEFLGMYAIKLLTLGFCVHLISRAYWLALICISHAFPSGVDTTKLEWEKPFEHSLENGHNLQESIIRDDDFCGIVIFMTVVYFFMTLGVMVTVLVTQGILDLLSISNLGFHITEFIWLSWVLVWAFYLTDTLLGFSARKIKPIAKLVAPFFKVLDKLTLREFYLPAVLLFYTNTKRRDNVWIFLFLVAPCCWTFISLGRLDHWRSSQIKGSAAAQFTSGLEMHDNFYRDSHSLEGGMAMAFIDQKVQEGNYMEFFLKLDRSWERKIEQFRREDSAQTFLNLAIDSTTVQDLTWHIHSTAEDVWYVAAMIPTHAFANGLHVLNASPKWIQSEDQGKAPAHIQIPFWIDRLN